MSFILLCVFYCSLFLHINVDLGIGLFAEKHLNRIFRVLQKTGYHHLFEVSIFDKYKDVQ